MLITLLKAKLHKAAVTHAELYYDGSCAISGELLDASGICEYEQIQIYNITNGERFTTYAIRAEDKSGIISINGAAAHKASPGHRIIICSYAQFNSHETSTYKPTLVYLNAENQIERIANVIPVQTP